MGVRGLNVSIRTASEGEVEALPSRLAVNFEVLWLPKDTDPAEEENEGVSQTETEVAVRVNGEIEVHTHLSSHATCAFWIFLRSIDWRMTL